ncbi:MAG TPA: hypothetical protein VFZ97_03255 [Acidimicrobiales bacterium]
MLVPGSAPAAWDDSGVESSDDATQEADSSGERWPLIKLFDLVAIVLLASVVVEIVGSAISGAGFPSSDFAGPTSIPLYSRLFSATVWANLTTALLLLAALAVLALPRIVWDVPPSDKWPGVAAKVAVGICGVASLATVAALVGIGNAIWGPPQRNPVDSLNVAAGLAAVMVNGLAATLSRYAIPYVREESEESEATQGSIEA